MIGIAITALALLAHAAPMSPTMAAPAATPAIGLPSLPKPKLPKLRMPHFPKRDKAGDPMGVSSLRLKAMVAEQEAWYSDHGTYSTSATKIARKETRADAALQTVQVQVLFASKKGWTAIASHPDAPGKSCVIYVGYRTSLPIIPRTRADAIEASQEAKAACDN